MPGSRTLPVVAAALAVFAAAVAGCGTDEQVVRIGVLADCQGALRGFGDGELAGAELPFLRRGARLLGTGPGGGVSAIDVGGRRVELVQGCQETGEHTLYIEEARRLLENEHVDVVVGGASIVARELARRYPRAIFVSTFWDEQEITMRLPAANLFRFSPDYAQREAGLGAYAYHQLGWRRAAVVADYANPGWAGAAAFTAEFCALGGQVVATVYSGTQDRIGRALGMHPDGIATFVEYIDPAKILGSLASRLHDPRRLLVSSANLEDPELMQTVGRRLDGVVGSTWLPSSRPSPVLRDYRRRWLVAFPGLPAAFANHSAVIGYYNALEETVSALGRIRSADVRAELMTELRRAHLDLPGGPVILDRNRQAVRDGYLSRIVDRGGKLSLEPVRVVPHVEQTFAGLLSSAPPPGPDTQPCRKGSPPAWAR
jgi:branched-chain amino acid transport system substrate-binding protein